MAAVRASEAAVLEGPGSWRGREMIRSKDFGVGKMSKMFSVKCKYD